MISNTVAGVVCSLITKAWLCVVREKLKIEVCKLGPTGWILICRSKALTPQPYISTSCLQYTAMSKNSQHTLHRSLTFQNRSLHGNPTHTKCLWSTYMWELDFQQIWAQISWPLHADKRHLKFKLQQNSQGLYIDNKYQQRCSPIDSQ